MACACVRVLWAPTSSFMIDGPLPHPQVPLLDTLVSVRGDREAQPSIQRVTGLTFSNLLFQYAGWTVPNNGVGYVDQQSGFRLLPNSTANDESWTPVHAHLQFFTVGDLVVSNCSFGHLGATAIMADVGSQGVVIANSTFADISCGGVYFGNANDANITDGSRDDAHFLITGNTFTQTPAEYHDCAVVLGGFVLNATISQNSIVNCSNTGISLGWGWSRDEASNAGWNAIVGNYIYGSNWLLEDGGSIYVLGPQPESIMAYNYVSHQAKLFGSLYTDEGSAYWHIYENVVNGGPEWLHIWTPSIHDELVENCWTNQAYMINHGTRCVVQNITYVQGDAFPPAAQAIMAAAGAPGSVGPKL